MIKELINITYCYKKQLILSIILYIVFSILNIISPLFIKNFIDLITLNDFQKTNKLLILFLILILFMSLLGLISNILLINIFQKIKSKVKYDLYLKVQGAKCINSKDVNNAEIIHRILNETNSIDKLLDLLFISFPINIISALIMSVIAISWSIHLTAFMFIIFLIQIFVVKKLKDINVKFYENQQQKNQELSGLMNNDLNNITLLEGINMLSNKNIVIYNKVQELNNINIKLSIITVISSILNSILSNIYIIGILFYGALLISEDKVTLGILMGFLTISNKLYSNLITIFNNFISFQTLKINFKRILEYLNLEQKFLYKNCDDININFDNVSIDIKNINFSYNYKNKEYILKNFTTFIKCNLVNVIIGDNGAGKTTLCKILSKQLELESGNIYFNNIDILKIHNELFRKIVLYQPQDKFLINGTILENIVCNNPVDYNRLNEVLRDLELVEFINELPNKIDTKISNNITVSLGQAQRIALARVYYILPKVVILDEPTSFVDEIGIDIFNMIIHKIKNYSTIIIITHSKEIIHKADNIIFLKR